jgi:hypothetical protein
MSEQITINKFLSAFFSDQHETINFRTFGAKGTTGIPSKNYETSRKRLLTDQHLRSAIEQSNKESGIYFVVNSGGHKDENINRYNAFFAENDNSTLVEQHQALNTAPIQPSIRIETKKSVHSYWLIDGECSEDEWRNIQARLIAYFDGDRSIKNPSRVMRLPFFNHVSWNEETERFGYKRIEVAEFNAERRFTVEEMKESFPLPEHTTESEPKKERDPVTGVTGVTGEDKSYRTWIELNLELGMRVMDQGRKNSAGKYEMRCPAHNGESTSSLFFDPETKAIKCMAECEHSEILKAFGLPEKPSQEVSGQKESQATVLVGLASNVELFMSEENVPYATIVVDNHKENWEISSKIFKEWLSREYYLTYKGIASENSLKDAISSLSGMAKYTGEKHSVHIRRAEYNGDLYLDLCNDEWQVVKITKDGWNVISDSPVKFRRTTSMKSIPIPVSGGSLYDLDRFVNIHGNDLILAKVWLLTTLQVGIPYPILVFSSQQKSGKSTSAKVLSELIDPNVAALVGKPKSEQDLFISVSNRLMVAFDNVSFIDENFSDALCRIATGGSFVKRELYTDTDEIILTAKNPILLNGIGDLTTRSDLLDRSIVINLPTLKEKADEATFWSEFEEAKPKILGALLDAVCEVLKNFDNISLTGCEVRMIDFAKVGVAVGRSLGLNEGEFVEIANQNYKDSNKIAFENNPVANVIIDLVNQKQMLTGTATELYSQIYLKADELTRRNPAFPRSAHALSTCLERLTPNLEIEGVEIKKYREAGTGRRMISIKRNEPSHLSHLSQEDHDHSDDDQTLLF